MTSFETTFASAGKGGNADDYFFKAYVHFCKSHIKYFYYLISVFVAIAVFSYAISGDSYEISAIVAPKTREDKGFDLDTLSGLAGLAGGGQRPNFERFGYLVNSESNARAVFPWLAKRQPKLAKELAGVGPSHKVANGFEQLSRTIFGKKPIEHDRTDQIVQSIKNRLKVKETPEGYLRFSFVAGQKEGLADFLNNLMAASDQSIREQEKKDYRVRISIYQHLLDQQTRTSDQAMLASLITREYSNYVTAQSGQHFSYSIVEPPYKPEHIYPLGLFARIFLAILFSAAIYSIFSFISVQMRRS